MERTPDDPNDEPTQMADYDYRGSGNYGEPAGYYSEYREPSETSGPQPGWSEQSDPPATPWYLKPLALIGWGVLTALLIAALVWGMVRLVNKESGHSTPATTSETSVTSTTVAPTDSPTAPNPAPVAPETPTDEGPATTTEPTTAPTTTAPTATTAPSTTTAPTTTEPPTTTAPTTTQPPTTTTAAPPTTTAAAQLPSEIVIPLPPGL